MKHLEMLALKEISLEKMQLVQVLKGKEKDAYFFALPFSEVFSKSSQNSQSSQSENIKDWFLFDGKKYTLSKPKKKNQKHLRKLGMLSQIHAQTEEKNFLFSQAYFLHQKKYLSLPKGLTARSLKQQMKEQKKKGRRMLRLFEKNFQERAEKRKFRLFLKEQKQADAILRKHLRKYRLLVL